MRLCAPLQYYNHDILVSISKLLLFARRTESAPVGSVQMIRLIKLDLGLILHDAELTDPVINRNMGVSHGQCRHEPLIVIAAI